MRAMLHASDNGTTLSISMVLYQSPLELVARTVRSLQVAVQYASAAGDVSRVHLQVVDNSSAVAYQVAAKTLFEELQAAAAELAVSYCRAGSNRGYGAGHNLALAKVDSDLHLILNPDVELAKEALLAGVRGFYARPDLALMGPRVLGDDGEPQHLCKRYPSVLVLLLRALGWHWLQTIFSDRLQRYEMRELQDLEQEMEVLMVSGCFMLVPTPVLKSVGGFDERYFLYFEDFDLSLRLAGCGRVIFNPAVEIVHHGGFAARKGLKHIGLFAQGSWRFFHQHGWRWL